MDTSIEGKGKGSFAPRQEPSWMKAGDPHAMVRSRGAEQVLERGGQASIVAGRPNTSSDRSRSGLAEAQHNRHMLCALSDDAERGDSARQGGGATVLAGRAHKSGIARIRHQPCGSVSHRRGRTVGRGDEGDRDPKLASQPVI